jgi:hypothetical protein
MLFGTQIFQHIHCHDSNQIHVSIPVLSGFSIINTCWPTVGYFFDGSQGSSDGKFRNVFLDFGSNLRWRKAHCLIVRRMNFYLVSRRLHNLDGRSGIVHIHHRHFSF